MISAPDFVHPPIIELVLGAQFDRLPDFTSGHLGLFWSELGTSDWGRPKDDVPLDDQFETFQRPRLPSPTSIQLTLTSSPIPGRFLLHHSSGDRLIQVQPSRFHFNWRKQGGFYPSFRKLIGEFEQQFATFSRFASKCGLGEVKVNQWELTYVNAFPQGQYWRTPADWSTFLPGLFGSLFPADEIGLVLENRKAEWSYEIAPKRGRLYLSAAPGRVAGEDVDSVLLRLTARGPATSRDAAGLRAGLDCGHDAAVGAFLKVSSKDSQEKWGMK